jgi:hypothetical protein
MRSLPLIAIFLLCFTVLAQAQSAFEGTSITQDPQAKVSMFPNPASEYLHVKLEGVNVANLQIAVHNIIGNVVVADVELIGENEFRLRVKEFTTGYYLLAMREEGATFKGTYKFLKR